ncbi:MAG: type II/IV secretion system ATPase subunit [Halobacteriales archaeon]
MSALSSAKSLLLSAFEEGGVDVEGYEPTTDDILDVQVPEGYEVTERYGVNEPYATISILYDDEGNEHSYHVHEPRLDGFEQRLLERLFGDIRNVLVERDFDEDDARDAVRKASLRLISEYGVSPSPASFYRVLYYLRRSYVGFGKIDTLMHDELIEDISCDGYDIPVYLYHQDYQDIRTNVSFRKEELDSFVTRLAQHSGQHISVENPIVSTTLSGGSRAELTLGREVTRAGSTFTVRKFSEDPFTPIDLIRSGTFSVEEIAYLWLAIQHGKSLIFAGGTASGKTTSMNAVSMFIPPRSKVVSIEDTPEIQLSHENWVGTVTREGVDEESRIGMYALLRSALRHRPEYIIVGEVRGEEAMTLFQAMNTGHTTYSTMHADSVQTVINRLENPPINVPRSMMEALDIVSVQLLTRKEGGDERIRRTRELTEIAGIDSRTGDINSNQLFDWDPATDKARRRGDSVVVDEISDTIGVSRNEILVELDNREKLLRKMIDDGVDDYREFTRRVRDYYANPEEKIEDVGGEKVDGLLEEAPGEN